MPDFRRSFLPGGTYFFTLVTYARLPLFAAEQNRKILGWAWGDVKQRYPFETIAVCLLPDHLHCLWRLPENDANYSMRWREIKRRFTRAYLKRDPDLPPTSSSRQKRGESAVWQRRFWEHTIRDETDLIPHIEYIHYNPVKHGLVKSVADWPYSSFHRYVKEGWYEQDWGSASVDEIERLDVGE